MGNSLTRHFLTEYNAQRGANKKSRRSKKGETNDVIMYIFMNGRGRAEFCARSQLTTYSDNSGNLPEIFMDINWEGSIGYRTFSSNKFSLL